MKLPSNKAIWALTYPIILGLFAENIINVTDTVFLARIGEAELGAAAIGGTFYVLLFIIGLGFSIGTQIIISRRLGEKKYEQVGSVFEISVIFLMAAALVVFVVAQLLFSPVFSRILSSGEVFEQTQLYVRYRLLGIFFTYLGCAFRAFYTGLFRTKFLLANSLVIAVVNVIFAYLLIFGKFGFPHMGIVGAAVATVIAEFASALFYVAVTFKYIDLKKYHLFRRKKYNFSEIRNILDVSGFIILQHVVSLASWFVFFLVIEHRGPHQLAITNIVRSIYLFLMIPGWAFGSATSTLVSNIIGKGYTGNVIPLIKKITLLCFFSILVLVIPAVMFRHQLFSLYTNDALLISESMNSFYVVMVALVIFSLTMNFFSGVIGTGRTRVSMVIELIGTVFYLLFVYFVILVMNMPLEIAWLTEIQYFVLLFVFSYLYLKKGKWKGKII
ncbi:MAG TPA: MATE family efflux transporter [Bacteroidales bacterium]|nr:MATE family efflux transporter [Bacteroidales bacterium]